MNIEKIYISEGRKNALARLFPTSKKFAWVPHLHNCLIWHFRNTTEIDQPKENTTNQKKTGSKENTTKKKHCRKTKQSNG